MHTFYRPLLPAAVLVCLIGCGRPEAASMSAAGLSEAALASRDPGRVLGSIRAARRGNRVLVEVGLENMPASTELVTMGLKLRDGTVLYPSTLGTLQRPLESLAGQPHANFAFGAEGPAEPVSVKPTTWLELTFDLPRRHATADESVFSIVLGAPEGMQACAMGITASIVTRDGSPSMTGCVRLGSAYESPMFPLLPAPGGLSPAVSVRLREADGSPDGARQIEMVPRVTTVVHEPVAASPARPGGAAYFTETITEP